MDKFKAWFKHSATILWARITTLFGLVLAAAQTLSTNATIDSAIHQILQPKYVPYYILAIGVITELARRRPASKDPLT